jgi:hypothetical protein
VVALGRRDWACASVSVEYITLGPLLLQSDGSTSTGTGSGYCQLCGQYQLMLTSHTC